MFGMVYHVFAEVALAAVGACGGIVAGNVAVLATSDIFGGAGSDIVGAAECIVILAKRIGHRRRPPLEAAGKQRCEEEKCGSEFRRPKPHSRFPSEVCFSSLPGLTRQS